MTSDLFPTLRGQGAIGVDCETCDPDLKTRGAATYRGGFVAGVAVATEAGFARYYPVAHEQGPNLDPAKVFGWLKRELAGPEPKAGANLLYDMGYLAEVGVTLGGPLRDVLLAEPLLDENRFSYDLDAVAKDHVGRGKDESEMVAWLVAAFGKKNPKSNIWRAPPEVVASYAEEDARLSTEVFAAQREKLEAEGLWDLYELEAALPRVLLAMRKRGVRVDRARARELVAELEDRKHGVDRKIFRAVGVRVDVWAAKSLGSLFDRLGLEYPRTPKTKAPSFTAQFLEDHPHPVAKLVLELRQLDKLVGTFLQSQILGNLVGDRLHCQFNQLRSDDRGTVSGRFSCVAPWTSVVTRRGVVRMDQVVVGDYVVTHKKRWRRVSATWVKGVEPMFNVHLSSGQVLTCTGGHRVYIEELDNCKREPIGCLGVVLDDDSGGDSQRTEDYPPQCFRRVADLLVDERTTSYVLTESLAVKDNEEPHAGEDSGEAPPLEGGHQGKRWIPDYPDKRRSCTLPPVRTGESPQVRNPPHRRGQDEQRSRQSSSRDSCWPPDDPCHAGLRQDEVVHIKKIEVGGDHLVFDISVEEDESYLACGVFSHNSSNPNLQFIPTRTDDGKRLRSLFLPDPGQRWYKIDWSQIEFRLMAHDAACMELPGADVVVEKYQDPEADYHQIVADMADLERRPAKTVNFGLAYGEGLAKLCRQLGLSEEEGRALVRRYHRLVPFMLPMARSYTRRADRDGVVTTLFGRKRRFSRWVTKIKGEEIFTGHRVNGASRRVGTHAALNARIQGSAADIMKKAMVEIHESGVGDVLGPMQLTVHDEVDGSYPDTKLGRDALAEMKQIMEKTVKLRVPLVADLSTGKNWGEC